MVAIHTPSLSARVFSGVTDGTVVTATVLEAAVVRWQQQMDQMEQVTRQYDVQYYDSGTTDSPNSFS